MDFNAETELFGKLESLAYAGVFSDVLDELNYRFQVISPFANIRPLKNDFVALGRACTLLNAMDENKEDPYHLVIRCIEELKPNSILVTTGVNSLKEGIMGELTATALRAVGARGAVVNGYTRDARKIINFNFPTFAWGSSPIDTTGRVRVVDYNIPIIIGGVRILPSDLLFCDLDGIVVIPKEVEQDVIANVLKRVTEENVVRAELAGGCKISEVWQRYHIL